MSVKETLTKKKSAKNFTADGKSDFTFKNELGSTMTLSVDATSGLLTGKYQSGVKDPNEYPLTGFLSGNVVSFSVSFLKEGSVGGWSGQFVWNESTELWEIHTLCYLVVPTAPADMWEDTYADNNLFTQVV